MGRLTDRMGVNGDNLFDNVNLTKTVTGTVHVNWPLRWYALHSEQFGMKTVAYIVQNTFLYYGWRGVSQVTGGCKDRHR